MIMDYEKKYKEALEKARQLCAYPTTKPFISDLQDLFPELAESEDERIRKALIDGFTVMKESKNCGKTFSNYNIPVADILAWLEKQGDKDKLIKELDKYKVKYTQEVLSQQLEKQGEQKIVDEIAKDVCKNRASATTFLKSAGIMNEKGELAEQYRQDEQDPNPCDGCINRKGCINYENGELMEVEQKPAWSKKDMLHFRRCLGYIEACAMPRKDDVNWFKSLEDRIQPQPRQEWSEEDEKMVRALLSICDVYTTKISCYPKENKDIERLKNWIEFLKDRYIWKPSKEQMDVLLGEVNAWTEGCLKQKILESLYQDLKKLRKE